MKKLLKQECHPFGIPKFSLKVKLTTFLFLLALMQIQANSYSQNKKISLNLNNVSVQSVLDEIESQTEFKFFIDTDFLDLTKKVSVNEKEKRISSILEKLFSGSNIVFKVVGKQIVLKPDPLKINRSKTPNNSNSAKNIPQNIISGTIMDDENIPLPGASILLKGTTIGVAADFDGNFNIQASKGEILVVSYIGFKTKEITITDITELKIVLATSNKLDEVVVVGYGTQKKANLTGAVDHISSKDFENRPVKDLGQALKGLIAGLNIETDSGAPGATSSFNIRGYTGLNEKASPLILIDGVEQDLNQINPEDVANVTVLKDASASAIYGSRAPYGVIIITTKSGKEGQMQINVSTNTSFSDVIGLPSSLNSLVFANSFNDAYRNARSTNIFDDETIQRIKDYQAGIITTTNVIDDPSNPNSPWAYHWRTNGNNDHLKTSFKTAVDQKHTVSFSGGLKEEKLNYYASMGVSQNNGNLSRGIVDKFERYNTVLKLKSKVNDWLGLSLNARYSRSMSEGPYSEYGIQWQFDRVLRSWPTTPLSNPDGSLTLQDAFADHLANGNYKDNSDNIWLTGGIELTPVKGLTLNGNYSWNVHARDKFEPLFSQTLITDWTNPETGIKYYNEWDRRNFPNSISKTFYHDTYHQAEFYANYEYTYKENHDFSLIAGYQEEVQNYNNIYGRKTNLISEDIPSFSTSIGDNPSLDDNVSHWATRGYFGRFNYNYKEKYLLEVSGRYDGSSRFPKATRDHFFPSFSLGYNIAKENFWRFDKINLFKIRGSYGELGDQNVSNYLYLPSMQFITKTSNILGGRRVNEIRQPNIVSSNITWEKPRVIDFGLDIDALNNKLSLVYNWYQRTTYDQLGPAETLPETLGATVPRENNAVTETRGWDITVSWRDQFKVLGKSFKYSSRVILSDYIGYVVDYKNETGAYSGNWTPGEVFGTIYGYKVAKMAQSSADYSNAPSHHRINSGYWYPGDLVYQDLDGDGKIDGGATGHQWYSKGDLTEIGNSSPRYTYGIQLGGEWNGFDVQMHFEGVGKRDVWRTGALFQGMEENSIWNSTVYEHSRNYWRPDNTDAYFTRPYIYGPGSEKNYISNDHFLQNGAYLRFNRLSLGYSFSDEIVKLLSMSKLKIYTTIENVGMIINKGHAKLDPIFLNSSYPYPPQRTISLGANITF